MGFTYRSLIHFFAGAIETYTPLVASKHEALINFRRKTLDAYLRSMQGAASDARIRLLNNPDAAAFCQLIPLPSEHIDVYKSYLRTLSDGTDYLAAFRSSAERHRVGPSLQTSGVKLDSPHQQDGELFSCSDVAMVGSSASLITSEGRSIFRGREGFSKSKLAQAFPGLCHGALLSRVGNPITTCHMAHHPDHGPLGLKAHALPSGFRKKVRGCWTHMWHDAEAVRDKQPGRDEDEPAAAHLPETAEGEMPSQVTGKGTPYPRGAHKYAGKGKGRAKGRGGRGRNGKGGRNQSF